MSNLKEILDENPNLETQRDLGSERLEISNEDREKFGQSGRSIIEVINPDVSAESNYFFLFKNGKLPEFFSTNNPFLQAQHPCFGKVAVLVKEIPTGGKIITFAEIILEELQRLELKRITLVGFDDGANVVQALTILSPRLFRRAILVDPLSRVSPGIGVRVIDWIERYLPVGLPFRAMNNAFDSRPFLHRIRCPIMVIQSPNENFYNARESAYIAKKIPNCYLLNAKKSPVKGSSFSQEFLNSVAEFQESPAKRPQKNR